jgi:hypothetical protein
MEMSNGKLVSISQLPAAAASSASAASENYV